MMKMNVKKIITLALSALLVVNLSACSSKPSDSEVNTSESGSTKTEKTEISVFTWGFPAEKEAREAQVKLFNETHEDIQVKIEVSSDYDSQLDAMLAANAAPDVIETSSDWYHIRSELGQLEDLTSYVESSKFDLTQYYENMINDFTTFDGKLESLPIGMATFGMAVNKDLFTQAGATIPENGWTWDEAVEAAKKVTSGEGVEKIYGMADHWSYQQIAGYLYGGEYTDPKFTTVSVNSPEAIKGIQFVSDWMFKDGIMPDAAATAGMANAQRFYGGKAAMMPVNNWDIPEFVANIGDTFDWDIYPMPTMTETGKAPTWYITEGYGIWSGSKKKDAAWEFISWVTSDPKALELASTAAVPPTEASAKSFVEKNEVNGKKLNLQLYLDAVDNAVHSPFGGNFAEMGTDLTNFWDNLNTDTAAQLDVTETVNKLQESLQEKLNEIRGN